MATSYTSILKLALPATGELAGTWGDVVNQNITSMIEEAIAGLATINTWAGASHTLTVSNGTTSESRAAILELSGSPGAAATVICPDETKIYVVRNGVSGGFAATIKTAAGTGVTIPNGKVAAVYCDGTNVLAATEFFSSVDIDGGTIDGTTIGATSASTGAFTTLASSSTTVLNGTTIPASKTLVDTDSAQTLTNKTLTSPVITTPTGIVKADVGLGNVDNTSDATKNSATATLTNKTLTNPTINGFTGDTSVINIGSGQVYKDASGNVGVGTSSPSSLIDAYQSAIASIEIHSDTVSFVRASLYSSNSNSTGLQMAKYRGTRASPTAVNSGDGVGQLNYLAYGGTNIRPIARIDGVVDTYTSDTNISGLLTFNTNGGSTGVTERMRIDASGNVGIGTSSPSAKLDVPNGSIQCGNDVADGRYNIGSNGAYLTRYSSDGSIGLITAQGSVLFGTSNTERARIDASGNLLVGTTSAISVGSGSADGLTVYPGTSAAGVIQASANGNIAMYLRRRASNGTIVQFHRDTTNVGNISVTTTATSYNTSGTSGITGVDANTVAFKTNNTERARIDSAGELLVGKTAADNSVGCTLSPVGQGYFVRSANTALSVNRLTNDGILINFLQDTVSEGNISVSGTTVSYNGGHLSRWAQTTTAKDESLVKGTVLSNLDEMNVYVDADGNPVENEQLNKVKVSDVEGDANVAGVFVNWEHDEAHDVDEINMAMTGDMIIRIAQGVTVQRGDLLMSAGDGTAKPQGDDIVRSKTIAKVTSTHVTCTYEDGSYCVPCVLMAC
jgi:hypothetical protein